MIQKTEISLLRKDGDGIIGTVRNANHHAEAILPFIDILAKNMDSLGFSQWKQGKNVHEFITGEGTRYTLRAFIKDKQYFGVRLALRISRSHEIRLIDIVDPMESWKLLHFMQELAKPAQGEESGVMLSKQD